MSTTRPVLGDEPRTPVYTQRKLHERSHRVLHRGEIQAVRNPERAMSTEKERSSGGSAHNGSLLQREPRSSTASYSHRQSGPAVKSASYVGLSQKDRAAATEALKTHRCA